MDCAHNVYECTSKQNLVDYLNASALSPTQSGWTKAINKGFFTTWPGLATQLVQKYLAKKEATTYGHLKQNRKGLRSTSNTQADAKTLAPPSTTQDTNQFPEPKHPTRTHDMFVKIIDLEGKIYTDQTGRFPVTSSRGHKYLCCAYDYDSNTIHAEPMKTKTGTELMTTYQSIQTLLSERGLIPKLHILDNECPQVLKPFMNNVQETFQLVPPHIHRRNAAERAIQTFKDHFIAGIASCHKDFPLHLWCRVLYHPIHK